MDESGTQDTSGYWRWSDAQARRMMRDAGFADVAITRFPFSSASRLSNVFCQFYRALGHPETQLARGVKRA